MDHPEILDGTPVFAGTRGANSYRLLPRPRGWVGPLALGRVCCPLPRPMAWAGMALGLWPSISAKPQKCPRLPRQRRLRANGASLYQPGATPQDCRPQTFQGPKARPRSARSQALRDPQITLEIETIARCPVRRGSVRRFSRAGQVSSDPDDYLAFGECPVISASRRKNPTLRGDVMPQSAGILW